MTIKRPTIKHQSRMSGLRTERLMRQRLMDKSEQREERNAMRWTPEQAAAYDVRRQEEAMEWAREIQREKDHERALEAQEDARAEAWAERYEDE